MLPTSHGGKELWYRKIKM